MMGYEGNRRSGVALTMRHRLGGLSTYGLKANVREMGTLPMPQGIAPLPYLHPVLLSKTELQLKVRDDCHQCSICDCLSRCLSVSAITPDS